MNELRERFAPLREETPTDAEIAAVLAARRRPRRRAARSPSASSPRPRPRPSPSPRSPARASASLAADARRHAARRGRGRRRPARAAGLHRLPLHRGARALPLGGRPDADESSSAWRTGSTASWQGRVIAHAGKVISGRPPDTSPSPTSALRLRRRPAARPRHRGAADRAAGAAARAGGQLLRDFDPGYEPHRRRLATTSRAARCCCWARPTRRRSCARRCGACWR